MELKDIQKLVDWLLEKDISEFEFEQDGAKIRIRRGARGEPIVNYSAEEVPQAAKAQPKVSAPAPPPQAPAPKQTAEPQTDPEEEGLEKIASPLVGTFYRKPAPNAQPFVEVGDKVESGQILCIVEAMKVMNEIHSTLAGEIAKICVEDGSSVEYGETLFLIRPVA